MLRLAGEIADGVILWLCNPDYVREVVVPTVTEGREKAGKPLEGFDIVAAVPSAVTGEPEQAQDRLRAELIPYFSLPFYRAMLERSGFERDIEGFDRAMEEAGPDAAIAAISDGFLATLAAVGSAEDAAATVRRYSEAGASSPCLGAIPKTDFDITLEALAGCSPPSSRSAPPPATPRPRAAAAARHAPRPVPRRSCARLPRRGGRAP